MINVKVSTWYSGRESSTCCDWRKHMQIESKSSQHHQIHKRAANRTEQNRNVSRGPQYSKWRTQLGRA